MKNQKKSQNITNEMKDLKMTTKSKGWPEERRKKQTAHCRKNKPWNHTTGPKTRAGKETSKYNAIKHGNRTKAAEETSRLLTTQKKFIKTIKDQIKNPPKRRTLKNASKKT